MPLQLPSTKRDYTLIYYGIIIGCLAIMGVIVLAMLAQ